MKFLQLQAHREASTGGGGGHTRSAPIITSCSWCGRVRYDDGSWVVDERVFYPGGVSHTVCPTCYEEAIPSMIRELSE